MFVRERASSLCSPLKTKLTLSFFLIFILIPQQVGLESKTSIRRGRKVKTGVAAVNVSRPVGLSAVTTWARDQRCTAPARLCVPPVKCFHLSSWRRIGEQQTERRQRPDTPAAPRARLHDVDSPRTSAFTHSALESAAAHAEPKAHVALCWRTLENKFKKLKKKSAFPDFI